MSDRAFRAVVVDDEPGARDDLCALLSDQGDVDVVGEASTVVEARRLIARERPDLVFLDIRLDRESGFDLVGTQRPECDVVFVTAHAEHAVRAFEVNALDYLLKPVVPSRLRATLDRLRAGGTGDPRPARPLEHEDWLFLSVGRQRRFLRVSDISHVTAAGDYSIVHTLDGEEIRVGRPLRQWQERLPGSHFLRIHRSSIVNLDRVTRVEPWSNYTHRVYLSGVKRPLTMSRHYARRAERLLK